jgi:hypothetical protein
VVLSLCNREREITDGAMPMTEKPRSCGSTVRLAGSGVTLLS